ncbi:MAG: cysteine--tRNA ligase [Balneolaceae bacterium]
MSDSEQFPVTLYNSLTRKNERFEPLSPPMVGLYVCGPTVYGDPHLGHARAAITFDIIVRYLELLGYRVRYVRNITDVGHLENEEQETGEDKIARKARLEKVEPMEVVQTYTHRYHQGMDALNCRRPSIEPTATGHILEQIGLIEKILENGWAYEVDGSVYFDLERYAEENEYGKLSGKVLEELKAGSRDTEGQEEKRSPHDFALWKKSGPEHLMRWESPWSTGYPGWHIECTAMSTRYLGEEFDIHGGGLDLQFPHHEAEIAQCRSAYGNDPARYWMHNNMVTIDGAKMSKSAGNFITLEQLFTGDHELLEKGYDPMVVRFLMLQSHYRSQIDFSNEALKSAEKGYTRLMKALKQLESTTLPPESAKGRIDSEVLTLIDRLYETMSEDFNTAKTLAILFEICTIVNSYKHGQIGDGEISMKVFDRMRGAFRLFTGSVLGLEPTASLDTGDVTGQLVELLIDLRNRARASRDFEAADRIRDQLADMEIHLKDEKDGKTTYEIGG